MATSYTDVIFSNLAQGGITATKLNKLVGDLSSAIAAGGGGTGTGDMTKAVYDTNNNGKVDTCDSVPWGSVTGTPSTFAPSAHQASHVSGTDQIPSASTLVRGLMPVANGNANAFYSSDGTQKQVAYTMLSGSQPGPVTHGASHVGGATDPIPVATTSVAGLMPAKPNVGVNATTTQGVMGDDTRLSDARTPSSTLAHQASHVSGTDQIPSATTAVRGLMPIANNVANNFYASDATQKQVTYAMLGGTQPAPVAHGASHVGGAADSIPVATTTVAGLAPAKPNTGVNATTTQVVMGDDTRLSDSRTPNSTLAHAASHLDNGTDPIAVVTVTRTGLTPKLSGSATTFLNGTGVFSAPAGGGDMLKSVYDTNADNIVDQAAAVPWTGVTGKPTTFPPDSTAMLKSVYDTNADNIVDHAALADAAPWTGITGKPATFPPDATAELIAHKGVASGYASLDAGIKVPVAQLPVATATVAGAVPTPPNNTTTFLRGDATFATPSGIVPSAHASTHVTGGSDVIATFTSTVNGLVPASGGVAGTFLRSDGTFVAPAGGGDMTKSVYDTNNDGIVDRAGIAFISKSAAYTLTTADSGTYVICSGGSWTLTLPAPVVGLNYRLRNDMGISGTIGTITVSPTGGTIDGAASIALLPQQECTLITDGVNWRTYGLRREVILGTVDITSATASQTILLPAGYRYFEFEADQLALSADNNFIKFQLSSNGGSTWITTASYLEGYIYDNALTTTAYSYAAQTYGSFATSQSIKTNSTGFSRLRLFPGSASTTPSWSLLSGGFTSALSRVTSQYTQGYSSAAVGVYNALKYFASAGNITNAFLTVKGVV